MHILAFLSAYFEVFKCITIRSLVITNFFVQACALALICPWLAFYPERLPSDKTDASIIAKERENEVEPKTAKDWINELVRTVGNPIKKLV